ncbi:hypothetical protein HB364_30905 [Pseudoflavitalea sp. X16]|uniref:DUF6789 family protein n=1 Tax=Paraflavitalea devenefica TaxID=2716334 RepID=UPI001420F980|nr:DUF6789 family protein [Paraflavitalea devenefica]NII29530.1 hypothetical protein [Paraflavitalea devenefica]
MSQQTVILLGSLFLSTGFALLVYILSGISFPATLCTVLAVAGTVFALVWRKSKQTGKQDYIKKHLFCGLISGLIATGLYDGCRFLLIKLTGIQFWPFDIFTVFGQSVLQSDSRGIGIVITGVLYHFANGIGFAIAYTLLWGKKGIGAGLAFAFALELLMVSVYPGWLHLKALDEFLQVSVFGHIVYGISLGFTAKYLLTKKQVYAINRI